MLSLPIWGSSCKNSRSGVLILQDSLIVSFCYKLSHMTYCQQGLVQQQTAEVDNAETAAVVAIDDREAAAKKLSAAQRNLEDAKGKQQHSLQVTADPGALPEVKTPALLHGASHDLPWEWLTPYLDARAFIYGIALHDMAS